MMCLQDDPEGRLIFQGNVMEPEVTVVIPTYGRSKLLARAVDSVFRQTLQDFELIVVMDGEDRDSFSYLDSIGDERLRKYSLSEKSGASAARNAGAEKGSGKWIAFLDDDDEWMPEKLETQIGALRYQPFAIATCLSKVVTKHGTSIKPVRPFSGSEPIDEWLFNRRSWLKGSESMLQTSSLVVPRQLFSQLQFGKVRHEEWEFVIRAVKQHGCTLITIREPLVVYYHGNTHYPWQPSSDWVDSVQNLITPKAYSGFCLNVATQGLIASDRNRAFATLLRKAICSGQPTLRQLFAFALTWLVPHDVRMKLRARFGRLRMRVAD